MLMSLFGISLLSMFSPPALRNISGAPVLRGASRSGTRTTMQKQHGERERNRRLRQIAAGSLRTENGLCHETKAEKLLMSSAYGKMRT